MDRKRDPLLDVNQVARRLSVSPRTVYRLIDNGYLPAARMGTARCIRIRESEAEAFRRARDEADF